MPRFESARVEGIPELAYALKGAVVREIRYWWGIDTKCTIFFSQIHQESRWDPDAKSKYASGLAQFTDDTAEWISKLYPKDLGEDNPLDPKWAIRALLKYDKWLFDRASYAVEHDNRWRFTLSGYNGGEGNVRKDRTLAQSKGRSPEKWICNVEHFSNRALWAFKENRDYVTKILDRWVPLYKKGGFL